jgi:hypothetical protein
MENQAPNRSCETGIAIVPASKPARAEANATCLQRSDHCNPQGIEIGSRAAGQGEANQTVHALFPTGFGFVSEDGILAFAVFVVTIPEFDPSFEGIGCKRTREPNWMLKEILQTGAKHHCPRCGACDSQQSAAILHLIQQAEGVKILSTCGRAMPRVRCYGKLNAR